MLLIVWHRCGIDWIVVFFLLSLHYKFIGKGLIIMFALVQLNTERKVYRRRRKVRMRKLRERSKIITVNKGDVVKYASKVIRFLVNHGKSMKVKGKLLLVPKQLCFKSNFVECVNFLEMVVLTFCNIEGNLILDFSKCTEVSVSALVALKTILEELDIFSLKLAKSRFREKPKSIKMRPSMSGKVNRHLHSLGFANFSVSEEEQKEYLVLGLMRGKSKNYRENRKAVVSHKVTQFVENTAERFDVGFDERGQNYMEGMVGEILSNAEDHSLRRSEWFVDGVSFLHKGSDNEVIEFNLVIINYGNSMYEGFELTKKENHIIYNKLEQLYQKHRTLFTIYKNFERESLFVLYMLNEGISRLKFLESSRGNGTMNFIKSFIDLGKFCNEDPQYKPQLNIVSGHTVLTCTEEYAPFKVGTHYKVTLNASQSMTDLPDSSVLKYFRGALFPGTILDCKIFLNKRDLEKNVKKGVSKTLN